jgi:hypothetical protein
VDSEPSVAPPDEPLSQPAPPLVQPADEGKHERTRWGDGAPRLVGVVAGALAYLLAALFLGSVIGALAALIAGLLAWRSHRGKALVAFATSAVLTLLALRLPIALQLIGAVAFAIGLLLSVKARPVV